MTANKEKQKRKAKSLAVRGRIFKGYVMKKFPTRAVIEFERIVHIPKYERYYKKKTKLHARIPENMDINIGDFIKVQECRPLSKIIHFIVIEKLKSKEKK